MENINLSIDCVILGFDSDEKLKVLLIKKIVNKENDYQYALPGDLLKNDDIESIKELYKRISIPFFCLVSFIISLIFSTYAAFFGRERTYFFLAIGNIFYLLLTISSFNNTEMVTRSLELSFFWMHGFFVILAFLLMTKPLKRIFGYEGL